MINDQSCLLGIVTIRPDFCLDMWLRKSCDLRPQVNMAASGREYGFLWLQRCCCLRQQPTVAASGRKSNGSSQWATQKYGQLMQLIWQRFKQSSICLALEFCIRVLKDYNTFEFLQWWVEHRRKWLLSYLAHLQIVISHPVDKMRLLSTFKIKCILDYFFMAMIITQNGSSYC